MSFGLLFSGQGTQHAQMLPWLSDSALVRQTEAALGVTGWREATQDPAWAGLNRQAQIVLTGIGLAAWAELSPGLPAPAAVAGYSVGELAAFCVAGIFDAGTALALADARAQAMDRCAAGAPGALLAVSGLDPRTVEALCADSGVSVAIRIAADAVVLGGPRPAVIAAQRWAQTRGAKCSPLNIAVASHTPGLRAAADAFAHVLRGAALRAPVTALFSNATAERVLDARQAEQVLAQQIARTVLWDDCLGAVHARRVSCVLEIGPGSALAAMWNRRFPEVPARSADEFRSAGAVVAWVRRNMGE